MLNTRSLPGSLLRAGFPGRVEGAGFLREICRTGGFAPTIIRGQDVVLDGGLIDKVRGLIQVSGLAEVTWNPGSFRGLRGPRLPGSLSPDISLS